MHASTRTRDLSPTYDPASFEQRWYEHWESEGFFKPSGDRSKPPFCIVIPPPNVTGDLHMGHALTIAIEDILVRWHRMLGDDTLWIPGTDHAGIPTQFLVERMLAREGVTRHDLGRERMVAEIWNWTHRYHGSIVQALRRLGGSCDWSRERFTLDEGLSRAVRTVFVQLYRKGLIYRGDYMVNWCPRDGTALSDLEVDHEEEQSFLWHVRYPVQGDPSRGVEVATTRPETMLGDTAVAVHPDDPRYRDLVGKTLVLPIMGREIPVVADAAVDPEFGTGAVKVTPAHDPTDYEIGQRHALPSVQVIGPDATMTAEAGEFAGMDRFEARRAVVRRLEEIGALVKVEPYTHAVARCDRCRTIIEPLVSRQWFVKVKPLAEAAIRAVEDGRIAFVPERFTGVYMHWMRNIHDWCISRQIWWGHRIPMWTCERCGEVIVEVDPPAACPACGGTALRQEDDVLDTWFSSALWPFSTMGWPDTTPDLERYYPTNVLETGYDILFHWVARMIMMGLECMGNVPFRTVYLHGLVRDEHGQKMSKTKGNVVDPLDVMAKYGTDSLRWSLVTGTTPGNDTRISEEKLERARNFMNKLWNALRFVVGRDSGEEIEAAAPGLPERWILSRLAGATAAASSLMESYQFGEAARTILEFVWGDLCDWYIEIAKVRSREGPAVRQLTQETLYTALATSLRLLHPYVPFVTEEAWQALPERITRPLSMFGEGPRAETIMLTRWPGAGARDAEAEATMGLIIQIVRGIRDAQAEMKTPPSQRVPAIVAAAAATATVLRRNAAIVEELARTQPLMFALPDEPPPVQAYTLTFPDATVYLPLAGMVDLDAERARIDAEIAKAEEQVARVRALLTKPSFVERAPAHVVQAERARLAEREDLLAKLVERRAQLSSGRR